jgi:hypothetical protein
MAQLQTPANKKLKIAGIYLGLEAMFFIAGLVDYNLLHKDDSLFMDYLGQLIAVFSVAGLVLCIYFLILRTQNIIRGEVFSRCLGLALLGFIFPILVLLIILSKLH